MFVTATERLDDFNKCRKPSILFDGIRKGKIKAAEASNWRSKFKHELSDIKKSTKSRRYVFLIDNIECARIGLKII